MYPFGGYNGSTWLNDLWMFDIDTSHWTYTGINNDNNYDYYNCDDGGGEFKDMETD